jgi:hypothetical protein
LNGEYVVFRLAIVCLLRHQPKITKPASSALDLSG